MSLSFSSTVPTLIRMQFLQFSCEDRSRETILFSNNAAYRLEASSTLTSKKLASDGYTQSTHGYVATSCSKRIRSDFISSI